jgi:Leucine-rich repeat (LRR) protein
MTRVPRRVLERRLGTQATGLTAQSNLPELPRRLDQFELARFEPREAPYPRVLQWVYGALQAPSLFELGTASPAKPGAASVRRRLSEAPPIPAALDAALGHWSGTEIAEALDALDDEVLAQVTHLDLQHKHQLNQGFDQLLEVLQRRCPRLESLSFCYSRLSSANVQLLAQLQSLKRLDLSHARVDAAAISALSSLPRLETLGLARTDPTAAVVNALADFPALVELDLSQNDLGKKSDVSLAPLTFLRKLSVSSSGLSNALCEELATLTELRELDLSYNSVGLEAAEQLGGLTQLEVLDAQQCSLPAEVLESWTRLKKLKRLDYAHNAGSAAAIKVIGSFTALEELDLSHLGLKAGESVPLGALKKLWRLELEGNELGAGDLPALGGLTELEVLNLRDCKLGDASVSPLGQLKRLEVLKLGESPSLGRGAGAVAGQLPELRELELDGAEGFDAEAARSLAQGGTLLETLIVNRCPLDPEAMLALATLPVLKVLKVSGCGLDDDGFEAMAGLADHLESLDLSSNPVGDRGVQTLLTFSKLHYVMNHTNEFGDDARKALHAHVAANRKD